MRISLEYAVGKVQDEFPDEETQTPDWPTWIGVIPAKTAFLAPTPDPSRNTVQAPPQNIVGYPGIDTHVPQLEKKFEK